MEELLTLVRGSEVDFTDGVCGTLSRSLVDSDSKTIAHLAVEEKDTGEVRLVPFDRIRSAHGQIVIDCSRRDFDNFPSADVLESVPSPTVAVGVRMPMTGFAGSLQEHIIRRHSIPEGETEVYGDEDVRAKHGKVGRLRALVVDTDDGKIERLLVTVGHIFAKHDILVPGSFIADFAIEQVRLNDSKGHVIEGSLEEAA